MKKEGIESMVDKVVLESLNEGYSIKNTQLKLQERIIKFRNILIRDNVDLEQTVLTANEDWQKITNTRHRFAAYYICFCCKRIVDLEWFSNKKLTFYNLSNSKMLSLLKFRDKLSKENAVENSPF
jgi:hypothetical protein